MAINTRTEYALRALLEMMDNGNEPISTAEICRRQSLPKKYIEHLLSGLKAAGFVSSTTGSRGGYLLAKSPAEIGLYDIMQAVEDTAWELSCNIKANKFCLGEDCTLHSLWGAITEELQKVLQNYSLQKIHLMNQEMRKL